MKKLNALFAATMFCLAANAQTDSTVTEKTPDTMRIGNIIIINKGKNMHADFDSKNGYGKTSFEKKQKSRVSTSWGALDLGFSNYQDKSNYQQATADGYLVNRPGYPDLSESDFKLKTEKSVNVNIWFFMQRVNLIKKNVNLKYGFGLELNNYRYRSTASLRYREGGVVPYSGGQLSNSPFIYRDSIVFEKNKLALDYITIPLMLNFSTTPRYKKPTFSVSGGVSIGYLYSQRNKQISDERGKWINKGNYDLEKFKFSYVAEIGLGPIHLYGSISPNSMYEHSLDIRPYNFGLRFTGL